MENRFADSNLIHPITFPDGHKHQIVYHLEGQQFIVRFTRETGDAVRAAILQSVKSAGFTLAPTGEISLYQQVRDFQQAIGGKVPSSVFPPTRSPST